MGPLGGTPKFEEKQVDPKKLFMKLLELDDEEEVVKILVEAGFWDDEAVWRPVGDNVNNRAIIGNQQEDAVSALAEKLTNSIDAVLINRCLESGVAPNAPDAPQTMRKAIAQFFVGTDDEAAGQSRYWGTDRLGPSDIDVIAGNIWISATGTRDQPSITIADRGEGQTPDSFPRTFMALIGYKHADGRTESQKSDIPFVQGQFNMGSSGTYPFASPKHGLQLLVSRRNPKLLDSESTVRDGEWGFTVVRRNSMAQSKGSVYEYLAPVGASATFGEVLSFESAKLPLIPESPPKNVPNLAYSTEVEFGTLIKLYQYQYRETGLTYSHVLMKSGLMRRLELVLPECPLPIRVVEAREFKGKPGSFQNSLLGIVNRLQSHSDKAAAGIEDEEDGDEEKNLTLEAPAVIGEIDLDGVAIPWTVYVFRKDAEDRTRSGQYNLILQVNGQKHAHRDKRFFASRGYPYLAKHNTILCIVDCTGLTALQREQVFKPSRDRLNESPSTQRLLSLLGDALKNNETLKELQNQQHARDQKDRLNNKAPIRSVLNQLLKSTPMLARFFKVGADVPIAKPFPGAGEGSGRGGQSFVGEHHPTYFRFKKNGQTDLKRDAVLGSMARIAFETDAEDAYLTRPRDRGMFAAAYIGREEHVNGARADLRDGALNYSLQIPENAVEGDILELVFSLADDVYPDPRICTLQLEVVSPSSTASGGSGRRSTGNAGGGNRGGRSNIGDLDIRRCVRDAAARLDCQSWPSESWTDSTAVEIEQDPTNGAITYYVNVDNKYLMDYQKQRIGVDPALVEAKFVWALVLLSLSVVEDYRRKGANSDSDSVGTGEDEDPIEDRDRAVSRMTESIAQLLLPMMDAVGTMTSDLVEEGDD